MIKAAALGQEMYRLVERLYPYPRSITGDGVRATLDRIGELIPLSRHEVPSGTPVLDWTVPHEWNIREAWIKDPSGRVVVDYADLNLHVVGHSIPVHQRMPLADLQQHLHSLPEQPELVPFRTSLYSEGWGFCLADRVRQSLPDGEYEVYIDATLAPGHLSFAECVVPGDSDEEVLISAHVCHPSLANDNLASIAVATYAAKVLAAGPSRRYTYRFVFAPGTIGAITWLQLNQEHVRSVRHGMTLSCLGDGGPFTFKRTFDGNATIDRAAASVLGRRADGSAMIEFFPFGYDERQYNSPGFRLPVGSLMRARHGEFAEYHTSADNLDFVSAKHLAESLSVLLEILDVVEGNASYWSLSPFGEPQLGRRGLYSAIGAAGDPGAMQMAMLWVLGTADGEHDLLAAAERSGIAFSTMRAAADALLESELIESCELAPPQRAGR